MKKVIRNTTKSDRELAANSLEKFLSVLDKIELNDSGEVKIIIQDIRDSIIIPGKALLLLETILKNMAMGRSVSVIPTGSEISTQEAADMINVSRPHLVKLLEAGTIPYRKVGSHRRILLEDMIAYEEKLRMKREKQLEFLARQAQELNLGYE